MPQGVIPAPPTARRLRVVLWAGLALASLLLFRVSDLDLWAAALFFDPTDPARPWVGDYHPLWRFLYFAVPIFTTLLAAGSLLALLLGLAAPRYRGLRRPAALLLLTLALGPGLLVNVLCKDAGGRPRPRQLEQFNGSMHYLPPLTLGEYGKGKSLAAGDPSVGFSLLALWLWCRSRRHKAARLALGVSLLLGLLLGVGRMAAGAHFLSDVLLTGYLTLLSAWLAYHALARIPERGLATAPERPLTLFCGYALLGIPALIGILAFFPVHQELDYRMEALPSPPPTRLRLELERGDVTIRFRDGYAGTPSLQGELHGRGLPNYRIRASGQRAFWDDSLLLYRVEQRGFFTRLDGQLTLTLDPIRWRHLAVLVGQGDIRIEGEGSGELPMLELKTGQGKVLRPRP